jgi:hypothetical protein
VPSAQEWQLKLATAPVSKATYMEVDFVNLKAGRTRDNGVRMKQWNLGELSPPLAALPPDQWTDDERNFVHYFTVRQMGYDDTECGFAALWAGYASDFALWHGERRAVPAAAYYALAAAQFDQALAAGGPPDKRAAAVTWILDGELHRILGQEAAATRCVAEAEKQRAELQKPEQQALDFEKELLGRHDHHLQRLDSTQLRTPPIGWYIDYLLPAMNGDLDVERDHWSKLEGVQAVIDEINHTLATTSTPNGR